MEGVGAESVWGLTFQKEAFPGACSLVAASACLLGCPQHSNTGTGNHVGFHSEH